MAPASAEAAEGVPTSPPSATSRSAKARASSSPSTIPLTSRCSSWPVSAASWRASSSPSWFSEVQWIHLGAWRALRAQLPDLVEDLFLGGEASLVVLGEDLLPVDADDEDAAAAAHDLTVQAELFLQRGRQTGGSRKVVSNAAIVDA